jgi:hypothetical protein
MIYSKTQAALLDGDSTHITMSMENKPITLRLDTNMLIAIDLISDKVGMSRQQFLNECIYQSVHEAIQAHCDAHGEQYAPEVMASFMKEFEERKTEDSKEAE